MCSSSHLKLPQLQQKLLDWTNWVSWCSVNGAVGQICSHLSKFPPGTGRALGPLRGDGEGEEGKTQFFSSTGHLELALSGSSWWCCL